MPIPKIIHQVWLGFDNPTVPDKWKKNIEKWKQIQDGYEHKLWSADDCIKLIQEIDPDFVEIFKNYPHHVQRADAIRPFILYKFGGIYTDLDTFPNRNIQPLLDVYDVSGVEAAVAPSANTNSPSNWFMFSHKNSKFWLNVIKEMKLRSNFMYVTNHTRIMKTTGPALIQDCIQEYGTDKVVVLSKELAGSTDICGKGKSVLNYITDEHAGTWNNGTTQIINTVHCAISPLQQVPYYSWFAMSIVVLLLIIILKWKTIRLSKQM